MFIQRARPARSLLPQNLRHLDRARLNPAAIHQVPRISLRHRSPSDSSLRRPPYPVPLPGPRAPSSQPSFLKLISIHPTTKVASNTPLQPTTLLCYPTSLRWWIGSSSRTRHPQRACLYLLTSRPLSSHLHQARLHPISTSTSPLHHASSQPSQNSIRPKDGLQFLDKFSSVKNQSLKSKLTTTGDGHERPSPSKSSISRRRIRQLE